MSIKNLDWSKTWSAIRDVATFVVGLYWGTLIVKDPAPADPVEAVLVAGMLSLPFAFKADQLRQNRKAETQESSPSPPASPVSTTPIDSTLEGRRNDQGGRLRRSPDRWDG